MRIFFMATGLWLCCTSAQAIAAPAEHEANGPGWKSAAYALEPGRPIHLQSVANADGRGAAATLLLERFQVLASDAKIRIDGGEPIALDTGFARTYLTGQLQGEPDSRATLIVGERGDVRGLVISGDRMIALAENRAGALVMTEIAEDPEPREFSCGSEAGLTPPPTALAPGALSQPIRGAPAGGFTARLAIETDYEYFQLFGNVTDAITYTADLIAFSSTVYQAEAETALGISSLSLWTQSNDPWTQNDTLCSLFEFGKHWNDNNTDVERSIAHFISGKDIGGGVAWVGVLCRNEFDVRQFDCPSLPELSNFGGDYGVSMGLDGNFDIQSPSSVWDIVVVAHEIGHNFNSPHTHCYAGLEGNAEPVDRCYTDQPGDFCVSGAASLPGPAGEGSGTIMSYCHFRSGGMSNIGLTLGLDHPYGIAPERVPNRMLAHVIDRESAVPSCLTTPLGDPNQIFDDGFELLQ